MKAFYLVAVLAVSALLSSAVNADTIPEEARRHMARGMAAVEMAKSPEEYGSAMREFQEASRLAPDWPDPHYNLGLVQEKSGKYREAVASLKEYLRLAPDAPDASNIKELIYKLEYKAEQEITDDEALDIFGSLGGPQWEIKGKRCRWDVLAMKGFKKKGDKVYTVMRLMSFGKADKPQYQDYDIEVTLIGRKLDYTSSYDVYTDVPPPATRWQRYDTRVELEIVSRTKVIAKGTTTWT